MVSSTTLYATFLGAIALERMLELRISQRNAEWALARGGIEEGHSHFIWMKLLHSGMFIACLVEVYGLQRSFLPHVGYPMLILACGAQALRYWAIRSLGPFWNVRVIIVPGAKVRQVGPYRFLRHPNYLAVVLEGIAIPMVHMAYLTALVFSLANALLLRVRIRCEEQALSRHCNYQHAFAKKPRFVPTP